MEILDGVYVARTGVTVKAVVRQARRVARSASSLLNGKPHYPAGVAIYLSPSVPVRVERDLYRMGGKEIADLIGKPLRRYDPRMPRLHVRLESDDTMSRAFEVAVLERRRATMHAALNGHDIPSDLVREVLHRWQLLADLTPKIDDKKMDLEWLAARTELPYVELDAARHARNRLAHPKDGERPLTQDRVLAAVQTARTAYERLQSSEG